MKMNLTLAALAVAFGASLPAHAGDVYVIANPGLSIAVGDVRDIFTGEKQVAGSVKLSPVDNGAVQADFVAKVIKVDVAKYNTIWTKKSFRDGVAVPPVKGSDAEVAAFVKSNPGGVGYVGHAPDGVKVVGKF